MKFRHIFMAVLAAVALIACEKEQLKEPEKEQDDETPDVVVPQVEEIEFTAETAAVKTSLDSDGTTVVWSVGDRISVWDGQANREFTASEINGSKVTFKGQALNLTEGTYYAVYPYSADNKFEGSVVKCAVPAVQAAFEGGFDKAANISVASSSAADRSFVFKNVCGLAMFKLDAMMAGVTEVWFSGTSALAGAFSADLSAEELTVVPSDDVKKFSLTGVEAGGTYYVPVLPSSHTSVSFTLVKGESLAEITGAEPVEFKSAVRTDFGSLSAEEFIEYDQFEIRVLEYGSTSVTEGSEVPAEGITGEIYMNVNAADGVQWYMTVTRNGEEWTDGQVGTGNAVTGTASRWFKIPESREADPVEWSVTVTTESTKVAEKSHTINFTQKAGVFRLDNFGGYTDTMPAVVKEDGEKKDMYIIVYATEGLQWTGTVQKNGEDYATITGTGRLTQDSATSSHIWIPNNTTASEVVWTVTVTTEAEVAEKTQTLTITQAAGEVSAFSTFEFVKLDGSGFNVKEGDQLPASGAAELYMNMNASSDVTWSVKVYKDGVEHTGGQLAYSVTGTGSRWFPVPANTTTSVIDWKVVAVTDNTNVPSQEVVINFTQAAGEATLYFTLNNVHIKGTDYTSDAVVVLSEDKSQDAYINVESNVDWTWKVFRDGVEADGGSATGSPGGRMFWMPYSETEVIWKIVVTTDAAVDAKEQTITITQRNS